MNKYLDLILNKPLVTIFAILLITLLLGLGVPKLEFESSIDCMMPRRDKEYIVNEEVKNIYGNNGKFIIICASTDDAMKYDFLKQIDDMHYDIEEYKEFDETLGKSRLEKFSKLLKRDNTRFSDMLNIFKGDPPFQRFLIRKSKKLFGKINNLDKDNLDILKNEIERSYNLKKEGLIDILISPITAEDLIGEDDSLITYNLIKKDNYGKRILPRTEKEILEFEKRLTNNPAFEKGIYVRDQNTGKITDFGILVRLIDSPSYDLITNEIIEVSRDYGSLNLTLQGIPIVDREIRGRLKADLIKFIPLVLLVVIIVFFLNFRSLRGVLLPFLTLTFADLWVLGLMGHLGYKITVIGVALPPLMIAVGSSYSIHILNQYYIDLNSIARVRKKEGLKASMSHITLTVMLAGVTTFIGFIMLFTNQVSAIREWGLFSGIGVLFAVVISITFIPAILALLPHRLSQKTDDKKEKNNSKGFKLADRIIVLFTFLSLKHYKKVIVATAVIIVISIVGLLKITVETSLHAYFKEGDNILTSSRFIGKKFGGSVGLNIILDSGEKDGIKEPIFLKSVEKFRDWLIAEENIDLNIGRSDAFTDFVKTMHRAMNNNSIAYYKIPEKRVDIESYIDVFTGEDEDDDGRIDVFESYVDKDYRALNIFARIWEKNDKFISTSQMEHLIKRINKYLDKNITKGATYKTSGEPKIFVRLSKYVVIGQIMSLIFSLIAVGFIIFLLFKNWRAGIISLIPISVAVIVNFGIMGWSGIRLDLVTAIIASITIGIGIDDTIHFLNTYRRFRSQNYTVDETISRTLAISGKAIIYTSLALIFGFMVLQVSTFKPVIYFGTLVAVTMVATTIGALLVLPSAIKLTGISLSESDSNSRIWKYIDIGKIFRLNEYN